MSLVGMRFAQRCPDNAAYLHVLLSDFWPTNLSINSPSFCKPVNFDIFA